MCYKINSSFILIYVLKNVDSCTFLDLVNLKIEIERQMQSLYIDVTRDSVLSSIAQFPEIFRLSLDRIEKAQNSQRFFNESVMDYFNDLTGNKEMRKHLVEIIEKNVSRYS